MLDGERVMDTCTCVGMHMHAFMGSLPQTDGRLHQRTTVYDASRPGTVCGSLQGCVRACTCVPRHRLFLLPVRGPSTDMSTDRASWIPGFRACERGRAGLRVYFSPCPEPRYGYIFMVDGGRGRGARGY